MKNAIPYFYAALWFLGGYMLLKKGILLLFSYEQPLVLPLGLEVGLNLEITALYLLLCAIVIGTIKGRLVLSKVAIRVLEKVNKATSLQQAIEIRSLILMGLMIALGISLKHFSIPSDVLGTIDIAVAAALLQTALKFLRPIKISEHQETDQ